MMGYALVAMAATIFGPVGSDRGAARSSSPCGSRAPAATGMRTSAITPRTMAQGLPRPGPALPPQPCHAANSRCCWTIPRAASAIRRSTTTRTQDPLLLPPGGTRLLPPLRDQRRRQRPAAADRRAVRRHRAQLPAGRRDRVRLQPLQALGELLAHAGGRAAPLRRRRPEHPRRSRPTSSRTTRPGRCPTGACSTRAGNTSIAARSTSTTSGRPIPTARGQMVFFGNQHPGTVMIDAKPIPGTRQGGGDLLAGPRQAGARGRDHGRRSPRRARTSRSRPGRSATSDDYRDPWPFSENASWRPEGPRIVLMDGDGATRAIYRLPGD